MSTLDELFSKDPLDLTPEDARAIVQAIRDRRAQWEIAESQSKSAGKRSTPRKAGLAKGALKDIDLDDLMGDSDG